VLPALTASADGKVRFEAVAEVGEAKTVGRLVIPMSARLLINDGQHRRAAIESALRDRPELGEEAVSVCLFIDAGLKRSQQMFSDLNRHVVRPSPSLSVLYDHRDKMAELTRRVMSRVRVFKALTEQEKGSITGRNNRLFTLSGLHRAIRRLSAALSGSGPEVEETVVAFWTTAVAQFRDWNDAAEGLVSCANLRRDFVHAHGVVLEALGIAGSALLSIRPGDWRSSVEKLSTVDWSREASDTWDGVALVDGRVSKALVHLTRTADYLKQVFGLDERKGTAVEKQKRRAA
jgi:DNA sulfur modification protein DndB